MYDNQAYNERIASAAAASGSNHIPLGARDCPDQRSDLLRWPLLTFLPLGHTEEVWSWRLVTVRLHASRWASLPVMPGPEWSRIVRRRGRPRESAMRRLYYRDSYGQVHRDRGSECRRGIPTRVFVTALMVLAAIVVLASLIP
jgi:hypothetical protein